MAQSMTFPAHLRATWSLALPLIGSQLAQFAIQLTDTIMIGWYGVPELAALVLANSVVFVVIIMGAGFGWAVMPLVAAALEINDEVRIRRITRMGLWASIAFSAVFVPPLLMLGQVFHWMGQDPRVADLAGEYLVIAAWGVIPALGIMTLRSYLAAQEHTRIVLWATIGAAAVNAILDWVLIFGHFGLPELGVKGAAIASVLMHSAGFLVMVVYIQRRLPQHELFRRFWRADWQELRQVVRLGWPISLTNLAEISLFAFSSIMMGWVGVVALAAHGIAMQASSATFMVHIGLSQAATVRAGRAFGSGDVPRLRLVGWSGIALSVVVIVLTVCLFLFLPEPMIVLFLAPDEPARAEIIATGTIFLAAAALFQMADGSQVLALGLLRGAQDTRRPMIYAGISYWLLGAPIAWLLAFPLGMGGVGIWLGLAVGLTFAAVMMMWRFWTGPAALPPVATD